MGGAQREAQARTRYRLPDDPYDGTGDETPPPRLRRPLIVAACLVALVAAVALAGRLEQHSSPVTGKGSGTTTLGASQTAAANAPVVVSSVPVQSGSKAVTVAGLTIPIGYPDTQAGAESAAANYVVAYNSAPMAVPSTRNQIIGVIGDPTIIPTLESGLNIAFTSLDAGLGLSAGGLAPAGETYVARAIPVGVDPVSESGGTAAVAVWAVAFQGVAGNQSGYPVSENWSTYTVTLTWRGDWKLSSISDVSGPVPAAGDQTPSTGQQLQQASNQFGGLPYAG